MSVINQTIYEGNITINGTSTAQYSYMSVPTVNTWVYYDYIYSTVYYWNYKDLIVKDMFPHSAKVSGGTMIHVSGAWFKDMPWHGVFPHCKFGDKIVRGFFDSTVRIACVESTSLTLGSNLLIMNNQFLIESLQLVGKNQVALLSILLERLISLEWIIQMNSIANLLQSLSRCLLVQFQQFT
jgi:hypothetical protein